MINTLGLDSASNEEIMSHIKMLEQIIKEIVSSSE